MSKKLNKKQLKSAKGGSSGSLYVIDDGIIVPDDIESLDIFKDAQSAAIYGSSSANRAITTKKGKRSADADAVVALKK